MKKKEETNKEATTTNLNVAEVREIPEVVMIKDEREGWVIELHSKNLTIRDLINEALVVKDNFFLNNKRRPVGVD